MSRSLKSLNATTKLFIILFAAAIMKVAIVARAITVVTIEFLLVTFVMNCLWKVSLFKVYFNLIFNFSIIFK